MKTLAHAFRTLRESAAERRDLGTRREPAEPQGDTDGMRNLEHGAKLQGLKDVSNGDKELGNSARTCGALRVLLTGQGTWSTEEILGTEW